MEIYQQKFIIIQDLESILADRTITESQMHRFNYFKAYFLKLSNQQQYFNRLNPSQKHQLQGLDYKRICEEFRKTYNQVKQRHQPIFIKKKGYYRKANRGQKWHQCFLQCNRNCLKLYLRERNRETCKQLSIIKLQVSKTNKKINKFYGFRIVHHNKTFELAFQSKYYSQSLHSKLLSVLLENKQQNNKTESNSNQYSKMNSYTASTGIISYTNYVLSKQVAARKEKYERVIEQFASESSIKYQLVKNITNGKIQFRKQNNKLKLSILIPKIQPKYIIESYLSFYGWNHFVDQFKIIGKIEKDVFSSYLRLKKYNFLTYPREVYLNISYYQNIFRGQIQSSNNYQQGSKRSYIVINTQSHGINSKDKVQMTLNQMIQLAQIDSHQVLMTLIHQLDYKSKSFILSNLDASLYFFKEIQHFGNYCSQYKIHNKNTKFIGKD